MKLSISGEKGKGKSTLIDAEDWGRVKEAGRWCLNSTGYVRKGIRDGKHTRNLFLHSFILKVKGVEIDHINGNPLDNQKQNLRVVTSGQNKMNMKSRKGGSSPFKGVCWDKQMKKWRASIRLNRVSRFIGLFKREEDAALAYNNKAQELFGEFARINQV